MSALFDVYKCKDIVLEGAALTFHTRAFTKKQSILYQKELKSLTTWEKRTIKVCGKECVQNRATCYFADDPKLNYCYSGTSHTNSPPFPEWLSKMRDRVQTLTGEKFNYCLLNRYLDGKETIGLHADDEKDLVRGTSIASVSFGAHRRFNLQLKRDHSVQENIILTDGSLLVMKPGTQDHYLHQVPAQADVCEKRYNITFRCVK